MKKKIFIFIIAALLNNFAHSTEENYQLKTAPINRNDQISLQRGAKLFANYCMSCHSLEYQRYNRLAHDIGLTEEQIKSDVIFTGAKIGDLMKNAMIKSDAKRWFGVSPPDLSLIARSKGVNYLYTYLQSFYVDLTRPFGVNNAVFPNVGMPHVFWELQGLQIPIYKDKVISGFNLIQTGTMNSSEFKKAVTDLVNFLSYVGEPIKLERQAVGLWVILFLVIAIGTFYLLKKEYWKNIH